MRFLDPLEELRWRILYSLLAVVVGTLVGWVIVEHVDVIALLIQPIKPLIPGGKLRVTSPTDPFFITLKFAFVVGLVLASPVVGYQAWAFLTPALYERERRLIIPALSAGALLFLAGASSLRRMGPLWLLSEGSIWGAWVVGKRRRRRQRAEGAGGAGGAASAAALGVLLLFALGGSLRAQIPVQRPLRPQRPDTARAPGDTLQGRALDSATARKLGLPTGPSRSFPPSDAVIDSLKKLNG